MARARPVLPALAVAAGLLAACATLENPPADAATCAALFDELERIERFYPNPGFSTRRDRVMMPGRQSRQVNLIRQARCVTIDRELDVFAAASDARPDFVPTDSGAAIRPTAVHVGILAGMEGSFFTTAFFRDFGYRARSVGVEGLGRRVLIGPFHTEGALAEAVEIARAAGFESAYPSRWTKF